MATLLGLGNTTSCVRLPFRQWQRFEITNFNEDIIITECKI